jgi:phosphatidylserine/phosphatidylglycerophosphate/cardiolipin synthase-like enzyme
VLTEVQQRQAEAAMTAMRHALWCLVVLGLVPAGCDRGRGAAVGTTLPAWEVYFSPKGGCTDAIVKELKNAQSSVRVLAYSFTSAAIARELLEVHRRGVDVEVILDKSNKTDKYSSADFLHNSGIPVFIDTAHKIQHNKVMLIDSETVITGSFNFSKAAENDNAENLLILRDARLAKAYAENYRRLRSKAEAYEGR